MFCKYCGKEIRDDSVFCPFCGKEQIQQPQAQSQQEKEDLGEEKTLTDTDSAFLKSGDFIPVTDKKKGFNKKLLIIPLALVVAIVGFFAVTRHAYSLADSGEFESASKFASFVFWDNEFPEYINSGIALSNGNYSEAIRGFKALNDYRESKTFFNESIYQCSENHYKNGDLQTAFQMFSRIPDYKDVSSVMSRIQDEAYEKAIELFNDDDYFEALPLFEIADKGDSDKYVKVIQVMSGSDSVESLKSIISFEPAKRALLKDNVCGSDFLSGNWYSGDRYWYIQLTTTPILYGFDRDSTITYNLPKADNGNFFSIEDSVIYFNFEDQYENRRPSFEISIIAWNTIKVKCLYNNNTYTLYRD